MQIQVNTLCGPAQLIAGLMSAVLVVVNTRTEQFILFHMMIEDGRSASQSRLCTLRQASGQSEWSKGFGYRTSC